jgi:hypothetical protein
VNASPGSLPSVPWAKADLTGAANLSSERRLLAWKVRPLLMIANDKYYLTKDRKSLLSQGRKEQSKYISTVRLAKYRLKA